LRFHEFVGESLVVALAVVVVDVLANGVAEVALAQEDQSVEALLLDRAHEALRVGIQVGAARREPKSVHATARENLPKAGGKERVEWRVFIKKPPIWSIKPLVTLTIQASNG
jgi:hypothetical protein